MPTIMRHCQSETIILDHIRLTCFEVDGLMIDSDQIGWEVCARRIAALHETERHRVIIAAVQTRSVVTVADICEVTGSSEATIRRDIAALDLRGEVRRVRGGAEAINPPEQTALMGRPFSVNQTINIEQKRAIARAAAELCQDGEPIIINGGTTTYQMVHFLTGRRLSVFTNSFAIAEYLIHNSRNSVVIPGGTVYREQNVILFDI